MSRRLDDLFDPSKLRDSWERAAPAPVEDEPVEPTAAPLGEAAAVLAELEAAILGDVGGAAAARLEPMLAEARALVAREFPPAGEPEPDEKAKGKIRAELKGVLDQVEDVLEALEVMRGRVA